MQMLRIRTHRQRMRTVIAAALYMAALVALLLPSHVHVPFDGLRGRLRLALDDAALSALISSPPSYSVAVLLPPTMLRAAAVQALMHTPGLEVAGIMVLPSPMLSPGSQTPVPPTGPYSSGPAAPQLRPFLPLDSSSPSSSTSRFTNRSYAWNPSGDGLELLQLSLAVVTVTAAEKDYLTSLAESNERAAAKGDFVSQTVEFKYYMYAKDNTVRCLEDATCMPLGGNSVWGTLGNLTHNSTENPVAPSAVRPMLLLATKQDSTAFFHQLAPGADDASASMAVLLSSVHLLAGVKGVKDLPRQIVFAFFAGESFSHLGSRKFVDDIQHFACLTPNVPDRAGTGAACAEPFKTDLAFQDIHLDKIERIIEVGQIGLNETNIFLHRERDSNGETDQMIDIARSVGANLSTPLSVNLADADTPGIPPSAAEAFLDATSPGAIATLVLTDHSGPFASRFWHSQFDSATNLASNVAPGSAEVLHAALCNKATFLARMAWVAAGGDEATSLGFEADCDLINKLLHCFLEDYTCDLVNEVDYHALGAIGKDGNKVLSKYTGVYQLLPERYISGMPLFLYNFLWPRVLNATGWLPAPKGYDPKANGPWPTRPRPMHVHDAVDPNLVFSRAQNRWLIKDDAAATASLADFPLWTESNWDNGIGFRTFRVEDPRTEAAVFGAGIAVALASVAIVLLGQRYCNKRFKTL